MMSARPSSCSCPGWTTVRFHRSRPCARSAAAGSADTFRVTVDPRRVPVGRVRELTAAGPLTERGGELVYRTIIGVVDAGCLALQLDLSAVTSMSSGGVAWLRWAWTRVG